MASNKMLKYKMEMFHSETTPQSLSEIDSLCGVGKRKPIKCPRRQVLMIELISKAHGGFVCFCWAFQAKALGMLHTRSTTELLSQL